jgi:hypothetical protein
MNRSLNKKSLKLTQRGIENLNTHIIGKETELVILKCSTQKNSSSEGFTTEFYRTFMRMNGLGALQGSM